MCSCNVSWKIFPETYFFPSQFVCTCSKDWHSMTFQDADEKPFWKDRPALDKNVTIGSNSPQSQIKYLLFWLYQVACRILGPQPESHLCPLHWKHTLHHWTAREDPGTVFIQYSLCIIFIWVNLSKSSSSSSFSSGMWNPIPSSTQPRVLSSGSPRAREIWKVAGVELLEIMLVVSSWT